MFAYLGYCVGSLVQQTEVDSFWIVSPAFWFGSLPLDIVRILFWYIVFDAGNLATGLSDS